MIASRIRLGAHAAAAAWLQTGQRQRPAPVVSEKLSASKHHVLQKVEFIVDPIANGQVGRLDPLLTLPERLDAGRR